MEENWELLELTGPFGAYAIHPNGKIVYSIGSVLVVWDVTTDKKINLRSHLNPVASISFSTDNEYFLTSETSNQPLLIL